MKLKTKSFKSFRVKVCCLRLCLFMVSVHQLGAQVQNDKSIYVHDFGEAYVSVGQFAFGVSSSTTQTSRSSDYGVLSFSSIATWSGANDSHFLDGYARYYGVNSFVMPLGHFGLYAPIKVDPDQATGVDGAYYRSSPSGISGVLDVSVGAISGVEYWHVKSIGSDAVLTFSWRLSSGIASLTNSSLADLVILGYDGVSWVEIPSTVDVVSLDGSSSTLTSGSITTNALVDLNLYSYFTFGSKSTSCSPLVSSSGITKVWNGSWSPSIPSLSDPVVINSPYSGTLSCNSLVLNSTITLQDGDLVEIINGVSGTGKIIMSNEASVVQRNPSAAGPSIELVKITNPMRRFDYVFLSSPITSSNTFFSNLLNKDNAAVNGNFGSQVASAFQQLRTFDLAGLVAINATSSNTPIGRGFSAAVRSQAPYSTSIVQDSWYTQKFPIHIKTIGTANNGNIPVTVPSNGWARIGNPYPSAISGEKLLDATGSNVRKTIYYWTYNTPRGTIANNSSYNNGDFATWNYSGGVAACATCEIPTGIIASMQSVLVKASTANSTTFDLTNCMRETSGNDNFFKNSQNDRFRLNLTGTSESFSQILIAYNENATNDEDQGFDGLRIGGNTTSTLSSLIDVNKYAIQTRSAFNELDTVNLQVDKNMEEQLTIGLASKEGVFTSNDVTIYLHDTLLGFYHNLELSSYSFVQSAINDATRFRIVYQSPQLNIDEFNLANAVGYIKDEHAYFQTNQQIKDIEIYDITGRIVKKYSGVNSDYFTGPFFHSEGVYFAKLKVKSGAVVTLKLVNKK